MATITVLQAVVSYSQVVLYTSQNNMKWKYQLSCLKKMAGKKSAWAQDTQNKLVNQLDEHDRGISWYKSGSVPALANATSSYTPSPQLWISSVRLTSSTKTPGLTPRGKIRAHLRVEFLNFSHLWQWGHRKENIYLNLFVISEMKYVIPSPFFSAAIMRRTAVCDHYILISARTWAGGGSISLKGIMLTFAPAPVLTYAVLTPPTARWDKVPQYI